MTNLNKKAKTKWILVVVVKCRHRENGLFHFSLLIVSMISCTLVFSRTYEAFLRSRQVMFSIIIEIKPTNNLVPRSLIDEGEIWSNPIFYTRLPVTGSERAHARSKSSIFDVLMHQSRTGGCKGMFSIVCMHAFLHCLSSQNCI